MDWRPEQAVDKKLQKIGWRIFEYAVPDDRGDPVIMDALLNWEPVDYVAHVLSDMT